jgi:hypothetical protein
MEIKMGVKLVSGECNSSDSVLCFYVGSFFVGNSARAACIIR